LKRGKFIICFFVGALLFTLLSGCDGMKESSFDVSTEMSEEVVISSEPTAKSDRSDAGTVRNTPEPTTTPEPIREVTSSLPQLQAKDGYMPPKNLDGIEPLKDKVVALTFDDGPHAENTPRLLDILKENDAVATFFMIGTNAQQYPDIVKRVYDEGHEIGTHSWNHKDMMTISLDEIMVNQYGEANDAIQDATGLRALIDRPPYGSMSEDLAAQIGREQILWSVDPEDWNEKAGRKNADSVYDRVVNGSDDGGYLKDGGIVLSHDIHPTTIDAYERIIPALKEQGYKFVTVTQMMQIAEIRGKEIEYRFGYAPTAEEALALSQANPKA